MCGCATEAGIRVYSGPERSLQDVAVLIVDMDLSRMESLGPSIKAIDGQKVKSNALEYHLLPGNHTIDFTYCITFAQQPAYSRQQAKHGMTIGTKEPVKSRASKTGDIIATTKIFIREPVTMHGDFKKGYVYKIFTKPVPCDPNDRLTPPLAAIGGGTFDGPFEVIPPPRIYIHRGLVLLGTVEEVACSPELLPYYGGLRGQAAAYGAAYGGLLGALIGYNSSPTATTDRAWKQIAEAHCPDKLK
jgi:hypothetical protein